jgi:hypothetical protein
MLIGRVSNIKRGEDAILYLKKAPATAPIAISISSITRPFIFSSHAHHHLFFNHSGRHYQRLLGKRAV